MIGVIAVAAIVIITSLVAFKRHAAGGLSESALQEGMEDLRVAISNDDPSKYAAAEEHFKKAASLKVVDFFPAFLIQTTRRLHEKKFDDAPPGQATVLKNISEQKWEDAKTSAEALGEPGTKPRIFYEEMIRSLQ